MKLLTGAVTVDSVGDETHMVVRDPRREIVGCLGPNRVAACGDSRWLY